MRATALGVKRGNVRSSGSSRSNFSLASKGDGKTNFAEIGLMEAEFATLVRQATSDAELLSDGGPSSSIRRSGTTSTLSADSDEKARNAGSCLHGLFLRPPYVSPSSWQVLVHPNHAVKISWDLLISVMIIHSVLAVPFIIGFGLDVPDSVQILDAIMDTFFALDIMLAFVTAYVDERESLILSHRIVARRYLSGFFIIDVLSVFPMEPVMRVAEPNAAKSGSALKILRLVRLMKLGRLFKLKKLSALLEEQLNLSQQMMDMIKIMCKVVFLVHLLACFMFWIAMPLCPDGSSGACKAATPGADNFREWGNWVVMHEVDQFDASSRYLATFHFITATLMAVGYGDIYPANSLERAVCLVVQLIGAVVFGFILSCITAAIETSNPRDLEHKKRMGEIKNWVRGRDLPKSLRDRVWMHFTYLTSARSAFRDEHSLLLSMPSNLRSQLVEASKSGYCHAVQAAFDNDERNLVVELAVQVSPMQLNFGTVVLDFGELVTDLFIVSSGRVNAMVIEDQQNPNRSSLEHYLKVGLTKFEGKSGAKPETGGQNSQSSRVCFESCSTGKASDGGLHSHHESSDRRGDPHLKSRDVRRKASQQKRVTSSMAQRFAHGLGLLPKPQTVMQEEELRPDYVLCGIYGEMEICCYFPLSPVTFVCGTFKTELFSVNLDGLERLIGQYPTKVKEFESNGKLACQELADAALSAEWSGGALPQCPHTQSRMRGLVVYKGKATDVRELPKEIIEDTETKLEVIASGTPQVLTKHLGKFGDVVTDVEPPENLTKRWIINSNDQKKIVWDLGIGLLVIYSVLVITYRVSFGTEPGPFLFAVDIITDIIFGADLLMNFRTSFIDSDGSINTIPTYIASNYLRGWFTVDFLSTAPIDRIIEASVPDNAEARMLKLARFARLFRLMKLTRMLKLFKLMDMAESSVKVSPFAIRLGGLLINVAFLAHMVACFWHWIVSFTPYTDACESGQLKCTGANSPTSWLANLDDVYDGTDAQKYLAALYWVFTTMTTVGYGDITPTNNIERIFAVAVMIFGATVFGYIVGSVAEMASQGQHKPATESLMMLRHYCEEQSLPQHILRSVRQHYEFFHQQNSPYDYEAELLSKMPPPLRKEVTVYIHEHLFRSLALFRQPQPTWLEAMLVRMLEPQAYNAGELIMHPREARLPHELYFIHDGSCEAYLFTPGHTVGIVHPSKASPQEGQNASKVAPAPDDSLDPLECYGPGSVVGIEPLLGEEAMQAFGLPVNFYVRASLSGTCRAFSLRMQTIIEAARSNPHMAAMLKEILSQTVTSEGKRRIKGRHDGRMQFYSRLEAALASQAAYVADIDSSPMVSANTNTVSSGRVQPPVSSVAPSPVGEPPEASIKKSQSVATASHIAEGCGDGTGGDVSGNP